MIEKTEIEELRRVVKVLTRRVEALEKRLAERSAAEEALEKRRESNRRSMEKRRKNVYTQCVHKEEEKGRREISPHTPYIEKREKEEEISPETRAREADPVSDELRRKCEVWAKAFHDAYPVGHRNDCLMKIAPLILHEANMNHGREDALFAEIMNGLRRWCGSDTWQRDFGRFIPSSVRFLRERMWADECPAKLPEIRRWQKPSRFGDVQLDPDKLNAF